MRSYCVRSIRLLSLLFVCLSLSQLPVAAADQVLVGASGMKGIQLDTWASGEIPAIAEGQALRLSRLHFDSCTGVVLHNNGGATLIYAESSSVRYAYQGGESYPNTELAQGQAIIAQPGDFLTIINPMVDPAFSVDLLILSVTEGDSSVDVPMIPQFEFPDDSACNGINAKGLVTPTILGDGHASESGDTLYLGSAFFFPGSTTAGWGLINPGSSFNMVILTGGMGVAGPNSGRAAYIGPGGVQHDVHLGDDSQIGSFPFVNDGPAPVIGLVFGTVRAGDSVWMPAG